MERGVFRLEIPVQEGWLRYGKLVFHAVPMLSEWRWDHEPAQGRA